MDSTSAPVVTQGHRQPVRVREPEAVIARVAPGSIAAELGLRAGDLLRRINDQPPRDVIDYQLWTAVEELSLLIGRDGEDVLYAFEKDEHEDLGLDFEQDLFVPLRICNNGCLFCFVLQAPPGMRPTVYVKDDDYRLSFLHGHFVTLTNLTEPHFERILDQRLSPLYVSVHASEPDLRRALLDNAKADVGWEYLVRLLAAGIECHTQVVLCPGVNDAAHLDRTITDLAALGDGMLSVSVVPVGLTRFQCHPLMRPMTRPESLATLAQIDSWRERFTAERGEPVVYAADELYLAAGLPFPDTAYYGDFEQVENGVGQTRLFLDDTAEALRQLPAAVDSPCRVLLVTGEYGPPILAPLVAGLNAVAGVTVEVQAIRNDLFGGNVRCTGLLCGRDLIAQVGRRDDLDLVLIPHRALNDDGVLLDDLSLADLTAAIGAECATADGPAEVAAWCGCPVESRWAAWGADGLLIIEPEEE